ncbi:L,D-transpeptidase family protein [Streptomyces sp. NBC_00878]|uniref:L,D-transpeptidase family protein n=1 Tax=Streptomyces sp. NBC_00878 TaxID=2975854 RepID=UPI002252B4EB|nr:L,D-transpeptidase family protein [Streptomyces sp. NBC_00878]MCX4905938.1 L,D-transpeptidase family protein [Streptomyces sp. NBC_00878]
MRIPVMWRTVAAATAVAALVAVSGCTVQTVGPTAGETSAGRTPAGTSPDSTAPGSTSSSPAGTSPTGTSPAPSGSPDDARPSKPPKSTEPPAPAPEVLWSRGDRGKDVRELQARLRQVFWLYEGPTGTYGDATATAVKGFQGKRGLPKTGKTDSVTWQRLLGMTREPAKWELYASGGRPAAKPDPRCLTGRALCISKATRTLRWMIDGRTVSTMDVRFGSQYTPTREGVFNVYFKSRHHVSTIYDSPMPYAMFFSGGQAVHYSSDFAARGYYGASHGCVNVRDEGKIAALFAQVRNGDKVVVYW